MRFSDILKKLSQDRPSPQKDYTTVLGLMTDEEVHALLAVNQRGTALNSVLYRFIENYTAMISDHGAREKEIMDAILIAHGLPESGDFLFDNNTKEIKGKGPPTPA